MKRLAFAKNPSVRFPVLVEEVSPVMEKVVVLNENFAAFHQQQPGKAMPSEQWYSEFFGFSNGKHLFAMLVEFVVAKRSQLALAMLEALFRQQEQRREVAIGQEMTASVQINNPNFYSLCYITDACKRDFYKLKINLFFKTHYIY
jgi:hypothetical protein